MKNATQIINSIQCKPQFHRLLEHGCISRLKSSLLSSIQKSIKFGYIKNETLFFVLSTNLNKLDVNNIINMIKSILNSPMIMESQNFLECSDLKIKDVVCFVDHKPKIALEVYSSNQGNTNYVERATGDIEVDIEDPKLRELAMSILTIIKAKHES